MIYKNDQPFELEKIGIEKTNILKKYKKWPIRLVIPKERINHNPKNTLPDQPTSLSFPCTATVKSEKYGVANFRYVENVRFDENGRQKYSPTHITLRGPMVLNKEDWELVWWLTEFCPYLKGGNNFNGRNAKCEIEDLASEADIKVERMRLESRYNTMLFDDELGLKHDTLKDIARAMFINNVEDLTDSQLRMAINTRVRMNRKDGVEKFLDLTNAGEMIRVKGRLQIAIDKKLIKHEAHKKRWVWVVDGGKNELICIQGNKHPEQALYDHLLGNKQFAETLYDTLREQNFIENTEEEVVE